MAKTTQKINPYVCEVKPCPCCGSPAQVKPIGQYDVTAYRVSCPYCHVATTPVAPTTYFHYRGDKNKSFTIEEAIKEVVGIWNKRTI